MFLADATASSIRISVIPIHTATILVNVVGAGQDAQRDPAIKPRVGKRRGDLQHVKGTAAKHRTSTVIRNEFRFG
jgi:hypothetical protein